MSKQSNRGQSLVEYAVVLALVAILVVTVIMGIGQRSKDRFTSTNEAFEEQSVAANTGGPAVAGPAAASGPADGKGRPPQSNNGNAYGHDKDNANGNAYGHDK